MGYALCMRSISALNINLTHSSLRFLMNSMSARRNGTLTLRGRSGQCEISCIWEMLCHVLAGAETSARFRIREILWRVRTASARFGQQMPIVPPPEGESGRKVIMERTRPSLIIGFAPTMTHRGSTGPTTAHLLARMKRRANLFQMN